MSEERMRILKMLEEGKINADEAAKLLAAVETGGAKAGGGKKKLLKVLVMDGDKEKAKVNVNLPLDLIETCLQFIPKDAKAKMEEKGIDIESIVKMVESGIEGKLVEVDAENKHVIIAVEGSAGCC